MSLAHFGIVFGQRIAEATRADKMAPNAPEVTEEIVEGIIFNHFFLADHTMANHGVLVELGNTKAKKCILGLRIAKAFVSFRLRGELSVVLRARAQWPGLSSTAIAARQQRTSCSARLAPATPTPPTITTPSKIGIPPPAAMIRPR